MRIHKTYEGVYTMETVKDCTNEAVLDLIFNGDWNSIDEFDEQLDELAEYSASVRESVELMET